MEALSKKGVPDSKDPCVKTDEEKEDKKQRRTATIRAAKTGRYNREKDKADLKSYLEQYNVGVTYGGDGGELTGQTIRDLAMVLFEAGDNFKTIKEGLPKLPTSSPYSTCDDGDEPEYEEVGPRDPTPDELKKAAEGLIEGINKLLKSDVGPFYINAIVEELRELELTEAVLNEVVSKIPEGEKNVRLQEEVSKAQKPASGGGKRARRVRRTKRTKGKSRGRAGKATRVRRNNNNNSNKTKRNKGKKRRTKRA